LNTSVNEVKLTGNLGSNPIIRNLEGGKKVARFSIAHNAFYNGQWHTMWINIVAWNLLADQVEKELAKGNTIAVSGRLASREYKKDDQSTAKITYEIVAEEITLPNPALSQAG
jgi:single-strand DNA-binding protein